MEQSASSIINDLALKYAHEGKTNELKDLLTNNSQLINLQDWSGDSLLSITTWHGHNSTCLMLLNDFDFDVNHRNIQGCSPLHRACAQNYSDIALMLYNKGANPHLKDKVRAG